ncbi:MAG: hypothetical protein IJ228_00805 [Succinivibrio sp.]|nr:hypothetical protein [Succinivibrio sp.]
MDRQSKQLYKFFFADKERQLLAEIAARDAEIKARDAEIKARDAEIEARDAELNRYRALFGNLPPQQSPAALAQTATS